MLRFILILWQLPQEIVGFLFALVLSKSQGTFYDKHCYVWSLGSAISLGDFIIVDENPSKVRVNHEYGHHKQSLYLGWLYLIVIGLPSFVWCSLKTVGFFKDKSYYWFYTESWADKLGGVYR